MDCSAKPSHIRVAHSHSVSEFDVTMVKRRRLCYSTMFKRPSMSEMASYRVNCFFLLFQTFFIVNFCFFSLNSLCISTSLAAKQTRLLLLWVNFKFAHQQKTIIEPVYLAPTIKIANFDAIIHNVQGSNLKSPTRMLLGHWLTNR